MKMKNPFQSKIIFALPLFFILLVLLAFFLRGNQNNREGISFGSLPEKTKGITHHLNRPLCFAKTSQGRFILGAGRQLHWLSARGELLRKLELKAELTALTLAGENIYAAAGTQILRLGKDSKMELLTELGGQSIITSIKIYNDDLYAADAGNRVLYQFNLQGTLQKLFTFNKDPLLKIVAPSFDFAVLEDGSFWITNPGQHQLDLYSREGQYQGSIPAKGEKELFAGCCNPVFLEGLPGGALAAWEKGAKQLHLFQPKGEDFRQRILPSGLPSDTVIKDIFYQQGRFYLLSLQSIYILED